MGMSRESPPKGTAGLARSRVSGKSLSPAPPASSTPSVSFMSMGSSPRGFSGLNCVHRYPVHYVFKWHLSTGVTERGSITHLDESGGGENLANGMNRD